MDALSALEAELAQITAFLDGLAPPDWTRPTRCAPMSVFQLCGHLIRQARQLVQYPRTEGEPEKDAVTYYQYDRAAVAPGVLKRAQEMAAELRPDTFLVEWNEGWIEGLAAARSLWEDDPLIETPLGTIRLREYLRTRVVEATVHHMDLRDALEKEPYPSAEGLAVTIGVLEGLLGTRHEETGLGGVDFVLSGTGRRPLTKKEKATLGPLAERFPMLQ